MIETWMVIDESGARHVANVSVEGDELVVRLALGEVRVSPRVKWRAVRQSVAMAARALHIDVAEVIAWGEETRGEMAASLHATLLRLRDAHAEVERLTAALARVNEECERLASELSGAIDANVAAVIEREALRTRPAEATAPQPIVWGSMPTPEAVATHAAGREQDGAPWMLRHADTSGDHVEVLYLRCDRGKVCYRKPDGAVWWLAQGLMLTSKWRPITDDGGVAT